MDCPNIDYEAEDWPDIPTQEEMMRQHIHLIELECQMLQEELSRYRKNVAKLIDIHNEVTIERDKLRAELKGASERIGKLNTKAFRARFKSVCYMT
ncbi:hypothetical protein [Pseudomonas sp. F3-2]|uniref:hypothetical protein n=1 Tax=Pseudomonas sp. F3-2 TaxID=3141539 RepID=UPI00315D8EBE